MQIDDNELDSTSSVETETLDAVTDLAPLEDVTEADSSTPQGATEDSTLSIVRDVVENKKDQSEAASPAEGQEAGEKPGDQDNTKKEPDNENYSDVPFNKHPRFQELLRKTKVYKEDATRYQHVQTFMDENGISAEEAADGFVIMGLIKTNPQEAWKRMKPIVQQVLIAAGEVLPEDLQQRVQKGELSPDAAYEVSRSRATVQSVETGRSFQEQQSQRRQHIELANSLVNAASTWEADRRAKDPNFEAKLVPLQKELAWIQSQEGKPRTAEGVQDQLKRAYAAVVPPTPAAPARPSAAQRPPQRPNMSAQISGTATPKPQSTLDIIRQVKLGRS
jgi:hypothetical protein